MKKIIVGLLVVLLVVAFLAPISEAKNQRARGMWAGAAITAGVITLYNLAAHGTPSPVIPPQERVYYPPPPPPQPTAYYQTQPPSPSAYYPFFYGQKISVRMSGWGSDTVRFFVEDELRRMGGIVIVSPRYGEKIDVQYIAEVETGQDNNSATVRIKIVRAVDGVICASGSAWCQFYYDNTDRERVYAIATQRAMANLH